MNYLIFTDPPIVSSPKILLHHRTATSSGALLFFILITIMLVMDEKRWIKSSCSQSSIYNIFAMFNCIHCIHFPFKDRHRHGRWFTETKSSGFPRRERGSEKKRKNNNTSIINERSTITDNSRPTNPIGTKTRAVCQTPAKQYPAKRKRNRIKKIARQRKLG